MFFFKIIVNNNITDNVHNFVDFLLTYSNKIFSIFVVFSGKYITIFFYYYNHYYNYDYLFLFVLSFISGVYS